MFQNLCQHQSLFVLRFGQRGRIFVEVIYKDFKRELFLSMNHVIKSCLYAALS